MKNHFANIFRLSCVILLLLCGINAFADSAVVAQTLPEFVGGIQKDAVWKKANDETFQAYLLDKCKGDKNCSATVLKNLGDSPQAIAFTQWSGNLLQAYHKFGNLYTITAWIPGARARAGVYIGNNQGQLFEIDNWLDPDSKNTLSSQPQYSSSLNQSYPNTQTKYGVMLSPYFNRAGKQQRFIFNYPLVDACRSIPAYALIAFDFDQQGNFINASFLKFQPHFPSYQQPITTSCDKAKMVNH